MSVKKGQGFRPTQFGFECDLISVIGMYSETTPGFKGSAAIQVNAGGKTIQIYSSPAGKKARIFIDGKEVKA